MTHPTTGSPDGSPTVSGVSDNASRDRLTTVVEAAEVLGITPDAVRSRLRRGTLKRSTKRGEEGEVLVILPAARRNGTDRSGDQSPTVGDQPNDQSGDQSATDRDASPTVALVEALRDQIDLLTRQLDEANRANSEHRRLLAAALERIPELEASQASPEAPDGTETASGGEGNGKGSKGRAEEAKQERRSWLYRFFFGP